jgi:nucleoprotein TPR
MISTALRTQIEQIRQATRTAEEKVASADSALEAAVSAVRKEKETAEALAATRQKQITDLEAELEKSRESDMANIRTSNNFKQRWEFRGNELAAARVKLAEIVAAKDKEIAEIKGKVADADKSLMETRRKMGEVEKKLADVTRSEVLKEGTVQRLQRELTAARSAGASPANVAAMVGLAAGFWLLLMRIKLTYRRRCRKKRRHFRAG